LITYIIWYFIDDYIIEISDVTKIIIVEAEDDKIDYTSNRDFKSIEILKNKMLLKIGRLIINLFKRV
jgi:hypothetical protein